MDYEPYFAEGTVSASVTVLVEHIGTTFWANYSHLFSSLSCPESGSTAVPKRVAPLQAGKLATCGTEYADGF
jgi:hypothetical protein